METYLHEIFQFTINSFKTGSQFPAIMANASKLCQFWQRVLFEGMTLKVACQERLESIVDQLIVNFLDSNLQMQLMPVVTDEGEDEEENFGKDQRTTRNDDLDFFAKLIK